jgi:MinD-like ATPase involved in chromosome partitioning or flagellar assembly
MATDRRQAEDVGRGFAGVVERFLGCKIGLAGFVCTDAKVVQAAHKQSPFLLSEPRSVAANCVRRLGRDLLDNHLDPLRRVNPAVAFPAIR